MGAALPTPFTPGSFFRAERKRGTHTHTRTHTHTHIHTRRRLLPLRRLSTVPSFAVLRRRCDRAAMRFCERGLYNVLVHGIGFMALFTAFQVRPCAELLSASAPAEGQRCGGRDGPAT